MNLARLRLITFDVTDTLLQFRLSLGKQYSEIGANHGICCDKNALAANFKTHWYQMKKEHPNFGRETGIGWEQWWKLIVFRTFKDADLNADEKKLELVAQDLIDLYKEAHCWQQCTGALGLLSYLRNQNRTIGVISNFDQRLNTLLKNTRLRHYFKFTLGSYEAGYEKPDKRIFECAVKQAELCKLKTEECLHIGDTITLDYIAARNAGWNAALISELNADVIKEKYPEVNPCHVYRTLTDLHKEFCEQIGSDK